MKGLQDLTHTNVFRHIFIDISQIITDFIISQITAEKPLSHGTPSTIFKKDQNVIYF